MVVSENITAVLGANQIVQLVRGGYVLQHPPIAPPAASLEAQAIRGGKTYAEPI